ncbi:MAG: metal-sensing transcriptional repressor [Ruminococcaceae bacterium]|nr:metal-sensing transcriptional repressor [Oscillospiraceae bacterium]
MATKYSPCCDSDRHTQRNDGEKRKLIHRLNRLEGQIRGLRGMVEADAYCVDILTQSAAAAAALNGFNKELMGHHIRGCVVQDLKHGDDTSVEELIGILHKLM